MSLWKINIQFAIEEQVGAFSVDLTQGTVHLDTYVVQHI
jgi:hypothetical protein